MKIKCVLIVLVFGGLFTSCTKKEAIKISGSTTVLPVVSNVAEEFKQRVPETTIIVNAGGSGVGINQLGEGEVEIGMASREITKEEIEKYKGIQLNPISIGKDAVVPAVSSEIYDAGIKALTIEQLGLIYKGKITNWKQVGGPDKEILCVDKEKSRGTRHVFMKVVLGDKEAETPGADLVLGSNNEEQTALVQSDSAIGMLSNAWLNNDVKGLSIVMPNGNVIEPTLENIVNGSFPITRDLFIITKGQPKGTIKEFVDFILGPEGQKKVEEAGYVRVDG